jgi:hypothetical protein
VVDNGASDDRLDYTSEEPVVVIAVGGATLSRGLTLEGLVSSFFLRASRTYDALMQMGRWFGYRPGYEDLPRMWMEPSTIDAFRFISTVEEEIRRDVERYATESLTPEQFAVRIRTHPSLAVTSPMKMQHAQRSQVSYAGRRLQTFLFEHRDEEVVAANLDAATTARRCGGRIAQLGSTGSRRDRSSSATSLRRRSSSSSPTTASTPTTPSSTGSASSRGSRSVPAPVCLRCAGTSASRDVPRRRIRHSEGEVDLGTVEFAAGIEVACVNRAQMAATARSRPRGHQDADVASRTASSTCPGSRSQDDESALALLREDRAAGHGLLVLYPISAASVPMRNPKGRAVRKPLDAVGHLLGVALVFPRTPPGTTFSALDVSYVSVQLPGLGQDELDELADAAEAMVEEG